jgi:hypothetical protein
LCDSSNLDNRGGGKCKNKHYFQGSTKSPPLLSAYFGPEKALRSLGGVYCSLFTGNDPPFLAQRMSRTVRENERWTMVDLSFHSFYLIL